MSKIGQKYLCYIFGNTGQKNVFYDILAQTNAF